MWENIMGPTVGRRLEMASTSLRHLVESLVNRTNRSVGCSELLSYQVILFAMSIRRLMITACRRPQLRHAFSRIAMVVPVQARRAMASVGSIDSIVFQDLFGANDMREVRTWCAL